MCVAVHSIAELKSHSNLSLRMAVQIPRHIPTKKFIVKRFNSTRCTIIAVAGAQLEITVSISTDWTLAPNKNFTLWVWSHPKLKDNCKESWPEHIRLWNQEIPSECEIRFGPFEPNYIAWIALVMWFSSYAICHVNNEIPLPFAQLNSLKKMFHIINTLHERCLAVASLAFDFMILTL